MTDEKLISYILLHTKHGKNKLVFSALQKFQEIVEIHELFGRYDILVKIETENLTDLKKFIQNRMWLTEGVSHAETLISNDFLDINGAKEILNEIDDSEVDEDDNIFD